MPSRSRASRRGSSSMRETATATSPRAHRIEGRRRLAAGRPVQPVLAQHQLADAGPAVMRVDPLDHHRGEMLEFEGEGPLDPHHQGAGFGPPLGVAPGATGPFELHRLAGVGQPRPDDAGPYGKNVGRGEALRREGRADAGTDQVGQGFGARHRCPEGRGRGRAAGLPRRESSRRRRGYRTFLSRSPHGESEALSSRRGAAPLLPPARPRYGLRPCPPPRPPTS